MISHRSSSSSTTGCYQYLSQVRYRVSLTPDNTSGSQEADTKPIVTAGLVDTKTVYNNNNNNNNSSTSSANLPSSEETKQLSSTFNEKDVANWSSAVVQRWIEEQCCKFELKNAVAQKFQMNGQALMLLTKYDFLRRSPDGGEVLFYALQRLINMDKLSSDSNNQNPMRNKLSHDNPLIAEVETDIEDFSTMPNLFMSSKPIIEEPDDPPRNRRQKSGEAHQNTQYQNYAHSSTNAKEHIYQPIFTVPTSNTYYHSPQSFPSGFVYAHHVQAQLHQQLYPYSYSYSHFMHQLHPMATTQGVWIEASNCQDIRNNAPVNAFNLPSNETSSNEFTLDNQNKLYSVTVNGHQYVMTEEQTKQFLTEIHRQQQSQHQQYQERFRQQQQQQQQQHHVYQQSHHPS